MTKEQIAAELVRTKFQVRRLLRKLYWNAWKLEAIEGVLPGFRAPQYRVALPAVRSFKRSLENLVGLCKEYLAFCGRYALALLDAYEEAGATLHDLAQILNCSVRVLEESREEFERLGRKAPGLFVFAVFTWKAEHRPRKQVYDDPISEGEEQPLFTAIMYHFARKLEEDREFARTMWEKLEATFPEIRGHLYTVVEKPGGEVQVEKYYPPLKVIRGGKAAR